MSRFCVCLDFDAGGGVDVYIGILGVLALNHQSSSRAIDIHVVEIC
jgi:hypothetical protein